MYKQFRFIALLIVVLSLPGFSRGIESPKPIYTVDVHRNGSSIGTFDLELYPLIAPKAVRNFDSLVTIHFYDSTAFHRVIPGFMIQGGDPNSRSGPRSTWGQGAPGQQSVEAEFSPVPYVRSTLGAARSIDTNSADSQFFICVATASHLNGAYTVYGRARRGMNIVDSIVRSPRDGNDNPTTKLEMFITRTGFNDTVPAAPLGVYPPHDTSAIGESTPVSWSSVNGALLYELELATDSLFHNIIKRANIATSSSSASNLSLGLQTYYWRVRANNGGFYSPFAGPYRFTTAINKPQHVFPTDASAVDSLTTTIRWNSCNGAVAYHLVVSTSPLFLSSAIVANVNDLQDTSYILKSLVNGKRYYWHVAAKTSTYEGGFSSSWSFFAPAQSSVDDVMPSCSPRISPQPATSFVKIVLPASCTNTVSASDDVETRIRLFSSDGAELSSTQMKTDENAELTLNTSCMESGFYILEIHRATHFWRATVVIEH